LCAAGNFAAAAKQLMDAIGFGDLPSRADLADMLMWGREGVEHNQKRAFELAVEGARLGCHNCQGVMAYCLLIGNGCSTDAARSLELARASAGAGSKYGQRALGELYYRGVAGVNGVAKDYAAALAQYRLAAAQGHDGAQNELGIMYAKANGVTRDYAEALRWFKLAAAQGFGQALYNVGFYYEKGYSVAADRAEAIRWYKRAAAAGWFQAPLKLERLSA